MKPITFPPHQHQALYNPALGEYLSELCFLEHHLVVRMRGVSLPFASFGQYANDLGSFMSSVLLADPRKHHPAIPELLSAIRNNS